MVRDHQAEYATQWAAITSIAGKIGCAAETLRLWVRQAKRNAGQRPGLTTEVARCTVARLMSGSQIGRRALPPCWCPELKPPLVFSPLPGRTDVWNERGIDKRGPYDQRSFTARRPHIAVICQADSQGQVEQFVRT